MKSSEYLWPHAFELKTKDPDAQQLRSSREQRTKYLKLPRMMATILTSFVFRKAPKLDNIAEKMLGDASKDIDGKGTSIYTFCKRDLFSSLLETGDVNLLVENFQIRARNLLEEKQKRIRPFFEILPTLSVVDWDEDPDSERRGKLKFLRHEYEVILPRENETVQAQKRLRTASRKLDQGRYTIVRYEKDDSAKEVEGGASPSADESPHWVLYGAPVITDLTDVPIARIVSDAWLDEVCDEAERVHNLRSNRDNILYYQGYQKLYAVGVQGDEARKAFAEYIISLLPEGGSMGAIEPVDLTHYNLAIEEGKNDCFKMGLSQLRLMPSDSRIAQAADTMSEEKDPAYARAESAIEDMENCVNEALEHWAAFIKADNSGKMLFSREISPESWDEILAIYQAFSDEFRSVDVVRKEVLKKAIRRLNLSEEANRAATAAIDNLTEATRSGLRKEEEDQISKEMNEEGSDKAEDSGDRSAS